LDLPSSSIIRLNDPTLPTNYSFPNPLEHTHCSDGALIAALPVEDDGSTWGAPCDPAKHQCAPNSRHNYSGLVYIPTTDQLFAFGGYVACDSGVGAADTWLFDFASNQWIASQASDVHMATGYGRGFASDFDPSCGAKGCVILHDGNTLYHYDVASDAYVTDA